MVDVADLFQSVLIGSLYALMALGLTLTYAVAKIPNFAHAEYVTVGAYTAALVTIAFGGAITLGGSGAAAAIVAAFALAFVVAAAIALLSDELVFRPLFRRAATSLHLLVASIGVGLIIRYALSLLVAPYDFLVVTPRIGKDLIRLPGGEALAVAGAPVTNLLAGAIPTTFGIVAALYLLFTRTRIGKGMRAMASNFDLARVAGIKTTNIRRFTWLLAGGLAGLGGAFWIVDVPGTPEMGWGILLWLFAASILGGFTSIWGTGMRVSRTSARCSSIRWEPTRPARSRPAFCGRSRVRLRMSPSCKPRAPRFDRRLPDPIPARSSDCSSCRSLPRPSSGPPSATSPRTPRCGCEETSSPSSSSRWARQGASSDGTTSLWRAVCSASPGCRTPSPGFRRGPTTPHTRSSS